MKLFTRSHKEIDLNILRAKAQSHIEEGNALTSYFNSEIILALLDKIEENNTNFIIDKNVPKDFINPDWKNLGRVHEWKNYISSEVQNIWHSFNVEQKATLALQAQEQASNEDWD